MNIVSVIVPLQTASPGIVLDLPGLIRAVLAFAVIMVFGTVFLLRYGDLVERSIEASIDQPLSSLGYGLAAHFSIVFLGAYTASQLGQLSVSGRSLGSLGLWVGMFVLAAIAALGFTVVGTAAIGLRWDRDQWHGLVVGAILAGVVVLADPLLAAFGWLVVVSTGIGGPVRYWFHAADDMEGSRGRGRS